MKHYKMLEVGDALITLSVLEIIQFAAELWIILFQF